MGVSVASPGVVLTLKTKYRTFTPDQFTAVFYKRGYTSTQVAANISDNPAAPPVPTVMFSKDNLLVFFNDNENLIKFHVVNKTDISELFEDEIKQVLVSLNYRPPAVATMKLEMTATVSGMGSPTSGLTSLLDGRFADRIKKLHAMDDIVAASIKMVQSDPARTESLTTVLEPLNTDPEKSYFVSIEYVTSDSDKFTDFVRGVGESTIERVVGGWQAMASQEVPAAAAGWHAGPSANLVGGSGIAPVHAGLPLNFHPNGYRRNQASQLAQPCVCEYGPIPEEGQISEELQRRLDDIKSGKVKMTVYPSADEYIRHLDAMLDG